MNHSEYKEQCAVFQWARMMEPRWPALRFMFAIPNAFGRKITPAQAGRYKAEGVKAGPPDIFLPLVIPRQRAGLLIEMKNPTVKRAKGGGMSPAQLEFRIHMTAEGYEHHVCYDSAEAIAAITDYLERWKETRRIDVPRKTNRGGAEDVRAGV
jgi:hypothetical protein